MKFTVKLLKSVDFWLGLIVISASLFVMAGNARASGSPLTADGFVEHLKAYGSERGSEGAGVRKRIDGEMLKSVLLDKDKVREITHGELRLVDLEIEGETDISNVEFPCSLLFKNCVFKDRIKARNSTLPGLVFESCDLAQFEGDGIKIGVDLVVKNGTKSRQEFRLTYAKIGGIFHIENSDFYCAGDVDRAINLTGAEISGGVSTTDGSTGWTTINGILMLTEASLGKLELKRTVITSMRLADFDPKKSHAGMVGILANWVDIKSSVVSEDLVVVGCVNFLGASIGGEIYFNRARFFGNGDDVWMLDDATIGASLRALDFSVRPFDPSLPLSIACRWKRLNVGGDVHLYRPTISCPGGVAVDLDGLNCGGQVQLLESNSVEGELRFTSAKIRGDLSFEGGRLSNEKDKCVYADGAEIGRSVRFVGKIEIAGNVSLRSSSIGADVQLEGADLTACGIMLNHSTAKRLVVGSNRKFSRFGLHGFIYQRIELLSEGENKTGSVKETRSLYNDAEMILDATGVSNLDKGEKNPENRHFEPQPYEQMASTFRSMGHEKVARKILTKMSGDRARFSDSSVVDQIWYRWIGWLIGYGYNPWRAFLISMAWVLIGGFIFLIARKKGYLLDKERTPPAQAGADRVIDVPLQAFAYSMEKFTPFLELGVAERWEPVGYRPGSCRIRLALFNWFLWLHPVLGWILASLWVGALTGLAK